MLQGFFLVCFRYKSWSQTSCHWSRPILSWARRAACCRQRRRSWKRRPSAGKLEPRSVKKTRKDDKNLLCWFITNILLGWCFIISHHKQTTYSVLLAFGEPAKRLRSRGVQTSALREGGTSQTHSAAQWGEHQTQSRGCQVRDYEWSVKQHIKSVHFPFSPTGSLPL